LERKIAHQVSPNVWSYTVEDGRSKVLHAQFEVRNGELKGGVLKAVVLSGLQDLENEISGSKEFENLGGTKVFVKDVEPITGGFLAKFQVHVRE